MRSKTKRDKEKRESDSFFFLCAVSFTHGDGSFPQPPHRYRMVEAITAELVEG